jgi:C-terminal processing protease CtpA/Prc
MMQPGASIIIFLYDKKMKLLIAGLCCIIASMGAARAQVYTATELQSDFDLLRSALQEAHGGLYRYSTKAEMDKTFTRLRAQLNSPLTQYQFMAVISELLSATHDGHMRLEFDPNTTASIVKARLLPLRLLVEGNTLRVLLNDTPHDATILPGMELVSINGHSASKLAESFMTKISGDGFIETGKKRRIGSNFGQLYYLLTDTSSVFTITAKDEKNNTVTATLDGIQASDRETNARNNPVNSAVMAAVTKLRGTSENISLRMIEGTSIASLRVRSFDGADFYTKLDSVFRAVEDAKIKSLILDLRGNGGGVDEYGAYLVAQFMNKPFRYFDHIHLPTIKASFTNWPSHTIEELQKATIPAPGGGYLVTAALHPGVGEQSPGKYPFTGKLVVLLDGGTFSTAADVCALIRHLTKAVFIGEESGGGYTGNTSGLNAQVKLPNSKLSLKIHVYDYYNAVTTKVKGRGTMPDYPVTMTVADVLNGIDRAWEKAMEIAKN